MSRRHGRLWIENDQVWYEDLGSSNGSWINKARIDHRIALEIHHLVLLGETTLSLVQETEEMTVSDGMTVQAGQRVSREDFAGALKEASEKSDLLRTLAQFVDKLLGAATLSEIAPCLRSLYSHLPTAQHIYLIGPLQEDGSFQHLVEPEELMRDKGPAAGSVSRSLARKAIERGEALLFSQAESPTQQIQESTRLRGIHSAAYVPLLSSQGTVLGVLCVDSPLSTLPLHEENLQLLKSAGALLAARLEGESLRDEAQTKAIEARELETRRETLANFLKIASHDLKNPLTVVKMCGVLIDRLSDDPTITDLCNRLLDAERRAEQLIASYLEVSELEATKSLTVKRRTLSLHDLVEQEFQFLSKVHERKQKDIELVNEVDERVKVYADKHKLEQVLTNLIGNAIKYGGKTPRVRVRCEKQERNHVVSVSDAGIGISEEDQKKLFAQFQRVGEEAQLIPGTGLGLWLSNSMVQAHGGKMWVESKPGEGSTFFFSLPPSPRTI